MNYQKSVRIHFRDIIVTILDPTSAMPKAESLPVDIPGLSVGTIHDRERRDAPRIVKSWSYIKATGYGRPWWEKFTLLSADDSKQAPEGVTPVYVFADNVVPMGTAEALAAGTPSEQEIVLKERKSIIKDYHEITLLKGIHGENEFVR